ncbi:putative methyltransferase YdaC [Brachyhypopomus gauderio]|uniref:putative methyltransferase YdaC n=1 Tax=Brachyhypopomus gauderio TaxID=698409 RepID=UPI00404314DA
MSVCKILVSKFGQQLAHPTQSIPGWLATKFFKWHNHLLEENAVKLCNIQPNDVVLEVGHGPGWGLLSAAELLTGPEGKLLGVDYSEYMHRMSRKRMQEQITKGKVILHRSNVAAMPIADNSVDKVFHCNSYYFWPDLKAGTSEIHRVMSPGGLMVTTLRYDSVVLFASKKILLGENWRLEAYMEALCSSGFTQLRVEKRTHGHITFQAVYATAAK